MGMLTNASVSLGAAVVLGLAAAPAGAQGWIRLPNGELGYQTDYTSTGFFSCNQYFVTRGACRVNGSSVTLTNGGNSLTLTYHGFNQAVVASNQPTRTSIGQITKSYSGSGPFIFPATYSPNAYYLRFWINVQTVAPLAAMGTWFGGYTMHQNTLYPINCCDGAPATFTLPVTSPPSPATYSGLAFYRFSNPSFVFDDEPMYFDASVSVTPEPATLVLVATGVAGMLGVARRRRTRHSFRRERTAGYRALPSSTRATSSRVTPTAASATRVW